MDRCVICPEKPALQRTEQWEKIHDTCSRNTKELNKLHAQVVWKGLQCVVALEKARGIAYLESGCYYYAGQSSSQLELKAQ